MELELNNENQTLQIFPRETCWEEFTNLSIKLDPETEFKLRLLKQKIEKERKESVTFGEVIKHMFTKMEGAEQENRVEKRAEKLEEKLIEKEEVGRSDMNEIVGNLSEREAVCESSTRYIPAGIRHELTRKYQNKCVFPNCNNPAEVLHHTERFALTRSHSAETIKPLCAVHHDIVHASLIAHELKGEKDWRFAIVDRKVQEMKMAGA